METRDWSNSAKSPQKHVDDVDEASEFSLTNKNEVGLGLVADGEGRGRGRWRRKRRRKSKKKNGRKRRNVQLN